jgi:hypothetical protein
MSIAIDPEGIYWKFFTILGKRTNTVTKCFNKQDEIHSGHASKIFFSEWLVSFFALEP